MNNNNSQDHGLPLLEETLSSDVPEIPVIESVYATPVVAAEEVPAVEEPEADAEETVGDAAAGDTDTDAEGESEDSAFDFPARPQLNNATQEEITYIALGDDWKNGDVTIALPSETTQRTSEYIAKLPNVDPADTQDGSDWTNGIGEGLQAGVFNDFAGKTSERVGADFRQKIVGGAKNRALCAGRPRFGDDGSELRGARGVMQVNAMLGRGSIIQIPLWHSGFWVTIKAPTEGRLLEMWQRMAEEKIMFGRQTHGLAFANHSVYTAGALVDLVIEHIYEHTIKDVGVNELRDLISTLDLNILAWGMACAIWPRGYQYTRSVLDADGQEKKVIKEKLNVGYLNWTDNTSLDDYQRSHMAQRSTGSMSLIAIDTYKTHFTRGQAKTFDLSPEIVVELSVPNITQYLEMGQSWVNETVAMVTGAFTDETDLESRNRKILHHARATSMRQYRHWIKSFYFPTLGKGGMTMDEASTVTMQVDALSADDELRKKLYTLVRDYIDDSTVSIIATPMADPEEEKMELPRFTWLLQMDPISTFFTLLDQKVYQIQARP